RAAVGRNWFRAHHLGPRDHRRGRLAFRLHAGGDRSRAPASQASSRPGRVPAAPTDAPSPRLAPDDRPAWSGVRPAGLGAGGARPAGLRAPRLCPARLRPARFGPGGSAGLVGRPAAARADRRWPGAEPAAGPTGARATTGPAATRAAGRLGLTAL